MPGPMATRRQTHQTGRGPASLRSRRPAPARRAPPHRRRPRPCTARPRPGRPGDALLWAQQGPSEGHRPLPTSGPGEVGGVAPVHGAPDRPTDRPACAAPGREPGRAGQPTRLHRPPGTVGEPAVDSGTPRGSRGREADTERPGRPQHWLPRVSGPLLGRRPDAPSGPGVGGRLRLAGAGLSWGPPRGLPLNPLPPPPPNPFPGISGPSPSDVIGVAIATGRSSQIKLPRAG